MTFACDLFPIKPEDTGHSGRPIRCTDGEILSFFEAGRMRLLDPEGDGLSIGFGDIKHDGGLKHCLATLASIGWVLREGITDQGITLSMVGGLLLGVE